MLLKVHVIKFFAPIIIKKYEHSFYLYYEEGTQWDKAINAIKKGDVKVYKTQGLTLPHVTLSLDKSIFAKGQAYVAMSQAPSWDKLEITSFDINSTKSDQYALKEYV